MKQLVFVVVFACIGGYLNAQSLFKGIQYQAIARDNSGNVVMNTTINVELKIYDSPNSGPLVYAEKHTVTTNQYGLFTLVIGNGTPVLGSFSTISWSATQKYLEVLVNTVSIGTFQFQTVPYALYALKAGSGGGAISSGNSTLPASANVGDFYIDTVKHYLYGPYSSSSSWGTGVSMVGNNGNNGSNGQNGNTILNGNGPPAASMGVAGDFYLDVASNRLYGPKTTTWPSGGISLVGPPGNFNINGTAGQTIYYNAGLPGWDANNTLLINDAKSVIGINSPTNLLSTVSIGNRPQIWEMFFSGADTTELYSAGAMHIASSKSIQYRSKEHLFSIGLTNRMKIDTIGNLLLGKINKPDTGLNIGQSLGLSFEGNNLNQFRTRVLPKEPTHANLLYLPNESGTLLTDPTTTAGDIIVRNATAVDRLPVGNNGEVLVVSGGVPAWKIINPGNVPIGTNYQTLHHLNGVWTPTSNLMNTGSKIGIGVASPSQTLSIGDGTNEKLLVDGAFGSVTLKDDQGFIQFAAINSSATKPMMYLFPAATATPRMVMAQSPANPKIGLGFNPQMNQFNYRGLNDTVFSIGINANTITYKDGNQSEGKILVADNAGNAHWKTSSYYTTKNIATSGGGASPGTGSIDINFVTPPTFSKQEEETKIEVEYQGMVFVQGFSGGANVVYIELKIDNNLPLNNSGRAILHKDIEGKNTYVSFKGVFENIPAGLHTIKIATYADNGTVSNVSVNRNGLINGGVLIIKETY